MTLRPRSLSDSASKVRYDCPLSALLLTAAAIIAAGCHGPSPPPSSANAPTPPGESRPATPRTLAYVRLDALVIRHPLWADMLHLTVARQRLASLVPTAPLTNVGLTDPYVLPSLTGVETAQNVASVRDALTAERIRARARLMDQAANELQAFLDTQQSRQDLLIAQRRAELEAAGLADEQRRARDIRDQEAADVRAKIAARSPEMLNRQLPVIVLNAQMAPSQQVIQPDPTLRVPNPPPVVLMPPAVSQKILDADIAKLEADPKTPGISLRARFTLKLQLARQRLRTLREELNAILQSGDAATASRIAALEEERLNEIEAELESLRDDSEGMFLVRSQRAVLVRALADEEAVAKETAAESDLGGVGGVNSRSIAGAARFESLFGSSASAGVAPVVSALGVHGALERVNQQQTHLKQFVLSDVRDAVRDAAETHRVDVAFAPGSGRQDMTEQFGRWIGLDRDPGATPSTSGSARGRQKG